MRTLFSIVLCMATLACKDKPKEAAPPATPPPVTPSDVAAPMADAAPAAAVEPGCEGWRASKTEHMGMGESSVSVECSGGKYTMKSELVEARGDGESSKGTLTREAWLQLWKQLDAAGWTKLPNACPTVTPPPDSFGVTELELSITDGKTTKQIKCEGVNVTAAHEAIMSALDDAEKAATKTK